MDDIMMNFGSEGFLKLNRSKLLEELLMEPACFVLLTQIAYRARRCGGLSVRNVGIGEALIGDYKSVGLTRQKYRTALAKLQDWGLITIKTTNKGTVAKLTGKQVFDINEERANLQVGKEICINNKKESISTHMMGCRTRTGNLGKYGNVRLKEAEANELKCLWGKERFEEVLKQLDEKIAEGKEHSENHFVTMVRYERFLIKEDKKLVSKLVSINHKAEKHQEVKSASFRRLSKETVYGE